MLTDKQNPQALVARMPHAIWRASEMAVCRSTTLATGFARLDAELPDAGWPRSALIELLLQQHGIGEVQLLKPVLQTLSARRPLMLIQAPFIPHQMTAQDWGWHVQNLVWVRTQTAADALWSAEQALKNGSCGAVLFWQQQIRHEALRRLHLLAQAGDTCLWVFRPLRCAHETSPAVLRLGVRPALAGLQLDILKRRGPHAEQALYLALPTMPSSRHLPEMNDAPVVLPASAPVATRSAAATLV
jgi:protein ImuA